MSTRQWPEQLGLQLLFYELTKRTTGADMRGRNKTTFQSKHLNAEASGAPCASFVTGGMIRRWRLGRRSKYLEKTLMWHPFA